MIGPNYDGFCVRAGKNFYDSTTRIDPRFSLRGIPSSPFSLDERRENGFFKST